MAENVGRLTWVAPQIIQLLAKNPVPEREVQNYLVMAAGHPLLL
ncbi:hypothetical protein AmDm5_2880 [Acetobacter malorum]|uniref:Uncharacterized protein n=1 Tax=Acetobacter malorum TaxID=178901 RepID=A0A087PNC5_9PROT|nr:hypothetical protein AmDm5_2880 [Acetobacter malorum]OAG77044.1 hypothetical protein Amal_02822 [Acetobacter malorum]